MMEDVRFLKLKVRKNKGFRKNSTVVHFAKLQGSTVILSCHTILMYFYDVFIHAFEKKLKCIRVSGKTKS